MATEFLNPDGTPAPLCIECGSMMFGVRCSSCGAVVARRRVEAERETLHDRFAMAALMCSVAEDAEPTPEQVAEIAYAIADAMMAERAKRDGGT